MALIYSVLLAKLLSHLLSKLCSIRIVLSVVFNNVVYRLHGPDVMASGDLLLL